ncbi:MAG: hypothetical protein KDE53_14970 [Caldilineaceae bacterium]|nr:hypothetical protein [Caldilineaceae bacterium]MCB0311532.1 hypothetical protein [Bdellovibrionales bacterium]HRW05005.1 hypothetical protein [Caldilineaceae bacterium]
MSVPKRFGVLRLVGTLLKVIAWIVLIFSILGAIGLVLVGNSGIELPLEQFIDPALTGSAQGIIAGIALLIFGLIYFLIFYASGESLHLQLAVEENTRLTAALLLRMHQETQQEAAPRNYGSAGFASDPFER